MPRKGKNFCPYSRWSTDKDDDKINSREQFQSISTIQWAKRHAYAVNMSWTLEQHLKQKISVPFEALNLPWNNILLSNHLQLNCLTFPDI